MLLLRDFRIMKLSSKSQKVALRKIMTDNSICQSRLISGVTNTSIDKGEFSTISTYDPAIFLGINKECINKHTILNFAIF